MRSIDVKELKKAMVEADLDSYTELSSATDIDQSTISSIVSGGRKPSYDTIAKFADALRLKYDEIGRIFFANSYASPQE